MMVDVDFSPRGWFGLVQRYIGVGRTAGGVILPQMAKDNRKFLSQVGKVIDLGPLCYRDPAKFGSELKPWCKVGDYVVFGKYAGTKVTMKGEKSGNKIEFRLVEDDVILGVISDPEAIAHYAQ